MALSNDAEVKTSPKIKMRSTILPELRVFFGKRKLQKVPWFYFTFVHFCEHVHNKRRISIKFRKDTTESLA